MHDGDKVKVKTLLCHSVSVHDKDFLGETGLHKACETGKQDMADLLIQLGADVNARNNDHQTHLFYAYRTNNPSMMRLLVQAGAVLSPVHHTVVCGDLNALISLLQQGADVNQPDPSMECSPMHVACTMGHSDMVSCLLQYGAHVAATAGRSSTPLLQACRLGHTEIALSLITQGADPGRSFRNQSTPLYTACAAGHADMARCLIQHGAFVNATVSGKTHCFMWHVDQGITRQLCALSSVELTSMLKLRKLDSV